MNENGFTLIELIAVLIIISVLTAVAIPKFINLQDNAENKLLQAVLAEFNAQEQLAFSDNKLSGDDFCVYESPIKDGKLSNGMTLDQKDDTHYVIFTGGGEYDIYRWRYENTDGCDSRAAMWLDHASDTSRVHPKDKCPPGWKKQGLCE